MERILLLNNTEFPNRFNSVLVTPPPGTSRIQYTEKKILERVIQVVDSLEIECADTVIEAILNEFSAK